MPNNETNHVRMILKRDDASRFLSEACTIHPHTGIPLPDFERIIPLPNELKALEGDPTAGGVFCDWGRQNWGTKWPAYSPSEFSIKTLVSWSNYPKGTPHDECVNWIQINMTFETAWTQPTAILETIAERYEAYVEAMTFDEGGFDTVIFQSDETVERILYEVPTAREDEWSVKGIAKKLAGVEGTR